MIDIRTLLTASAALAGVIALVLLAARSAQMTGMGRARPDARLALTASLALDRTRRLVVVRCDGRDLLLLTGGSGDRFVGWLDGQGRGA